MTPRGLVLGTGWKMNHTIRQAVDYTRGLLKHLDTIGGGDSFQVFVVPPFTAIEAVKRAAGYTAEARD